MHRKRHTHHVHHTWAHEKRMAYESIVHSVIDSEAPAEALARRDNCKPGDNSPQCEKPAAAKGSLPIILGSLVPIVIACIVLYFLHRRHMKRLRLEEIHDKTKSMDFGMGFGSGARKTGGEKTVKGHKGHQISMDLDLNNPYVLPGTLQGSRESLHSLSKAFDASDPRYGLRPGTSHSQKGGLTLGQQNYAPSQHSNLAHSKTRESSLYTASVKNDSPNGSTSSMSDELLSKAQGMAMSSPPPPMSPTSPRTRSQVPQLRIPSPPPAAVITSPRTPNGLPALLQPGGPRDVSMQAPLLPTTPTLDLEFNLTISTPEQTSQLQKVSEEVGTVKAEARPPSDASNYADDTNTGISFRFSTASENDKTVKPTSRNPTRDTLAPGGFGDRRLSMGFRPLPPDRFPDESADQRASRIRSFYKEYFDDQGGNHDRQSFYQPGGYCEDVTDDYMPTHHDDSTAVYDYSSGSYVIPGARPFAEPPVRRAMTPPPRMPQGYEGPRSQSSISNTQGPRSYTSHNGRGPTTRGPPRKPMPPPAPLKNIPTPARLGEDAFAAPISFAPKVRVQDIVTGRDSPSFFSGERPYSPSVPVHTPLISAFDELPSLMAPHHLRKSGTFTALGFAPPKKFKNDDGSGSDAGSVRSGRSQLNPTNVHAIRAGAYRVSRIPQGVVPLKDDMAAQLRPTMDLSTRY